jgi:hypothetical protein
VLDFEIDPRQLLYEESKNQRAPSPSAPDDWLPETVSYDDGWPGYDEPIFDF